MKQLFSLITIILISLPLIFQPVIALQQIATKICLEGGMFKHNTVEKLVAILTDSDGNPLEGKVVNFYVNTSIGWHYIGSNLTNGSGMAVLTINVTMPNGIYLFKAEFAGDTRYLPSHDVANVIVIEDPIPALALWLLAGVAWGAAEEFILKPYVLRPFLFKPIANIIGTEPETIEVCWDTIWLIAGLHAMASAATKAGTQFAKASLVSGKAIGGHMRWFWHYSYKTALEFGKIAAEALIMELENRGYTLTEEKKKQINDLTGDAINAYMEKLWHSTFLEMFIVDPIIGHSEIIEVPENVKRMRIYLGWNMSGYSDNFFILKDPSGHTVIPKISVALSTDPEATKVNVELVIWEPQAGNWVLWLNGSKLPNEIVGMLVQFDKVFEILPQHIPINPGYTRSVAAVLNNFGSEMLMASLSPRNVPTGWNVSIPPYCPILFPNSSSIMPIYVTPPPNIKYGTSQTLEIETTINGTTYVESFTAHIYPYIEIEDGIAYLHKQQLPNGSWQNNVGITAICLLAYLNAGYDESVEDVRKAINYILAHVKPDGSIYTSHPTYETSLAILALVATYNKSYNEIIENAKNWLLNSQWDENCLWGSVNKDHWYYGGFGYGWGTRPDLSNTQFAIMALDAAGVPKDDLVWAKLQVFLARCQNLQRDIYIPELNYTVRWTPAYNAYNDGGFVYHPGASLAGYMKSYGSMTGAGIWGLKLCGISNDDPRMQAALNWVKSHYTWDENPEMGTSGLYYYYMTMSKAMVLSVGVNGEINGHRWYDDLTKKLIELQHPEGCWVNTNPSFWENIPELTTAYAILSLEYRIRPPEVERPSWLAFILRSNADLHVYDPFGRHVGKNYETGEIEIEIPNATYESNDYQRIIVPYIEVGTYRIMLIGTGTGEYNLTIITGAGEQVFREESYAGTITKGEVHEALVEVTTIVGTTVKVRELRPSKYTIQTVTNKGNVSFVLDSGIIRNLTTINESDLPTDGKPALSFPYGFFSFNITGLTPGQIVNVIIVFPEDIPTTAQYWKYHVPEGWYQIPLLSNDGDNVIIIRLTDGGLGDDDGVTNGVITDAGGLGIPIPKLPVGGKIISEEILIPSLINGTLIYLTLLLVATITLVSLLIWKGFK